MLNKKKILGLIIGLGDLTRKDLCNYTRLSMKEVDKIVDQLIKEGRIVES